MQERNNPAMPLDRPKLACIPESMNDSEAWQIFEEAMRDVESFDEAMDWLNKNPHIKENLTVFEMMRQFNKTISEANKYYRN